jgi:hypothetical protein
MTVELTGRAQELVEVALARGLGKSPEEVVEVALEGMAAPAPVGELTEEEKERARRAVEGLLAFNEKYHFKLGPGERIVDLIREGRKY